MVTAVQSPAPIAPEPAPKQVAPSPKQEPQVAIDWGTDASTWSAEVGKRVSLTLPPDGSARTIWGTGVYTDDSSIGTAAVHMGLITFTQGGKITIEIRGGYESYEGSSINGVSSDSYGAWDASFVFIDAKGNVVLPQKPSNTTIEIPGADWSISAAQWEVKPGVRYSVTLPPGGSAGSVWGTDIYTNDSSIGTAAVHAGLITFNAGGKVTLELVEGKPSYEGSTRNGVTSSSYGNWGGSYRFVK